MQIHDAYERLSRQNLHGRADPRSGRELQEWREVSVDNCVQRMGHGMCSIGGDVYLFGGVNERGSFTNELYILQYIRRTFGSTGSGDAVQHPKRERSLMLHELVPCIEPENELGDADYDSDDDESLFSYKNKRVDLHSGVGGTAHLMFTFPHGNPESGDPERQHMVIPNLPNLVNV